jgi:hypothetical protein
MYIANPMVRKRTGADNRDFDGQPIDVGFAATNALETINGYMFGNVPGLTMRQGDRVRWHPQAWARIPYRPLAGQHGVLDQRSTDVVSALPAEMHKTDMVVLNPAVWIRHWHMGNHVAGGILAR